MRLFLDAEGWTMEGESAFLDWLSGEAKVENGPGVIHFVFVDDAQITEMNEQYLEHEGSTDVISFAMEGDGTEEFVLPEDESEIEDVPFPEGEVYVSLDTALRQAEEYGVSLTDEVSRLAVHGLLHVCGWDDASDEERKAMSRREDEGLTRARGGAGALPWTIQRSLT